MGKKKLKKKVTSKVTSEKQSSPLRQPFGKTEQWIGAVALIFIILFIYWGVPLLIDGKSPIGSDVIGGIGKVHQIIEYEKETGEQALWNPYVFSGMPQYPPSSCLARMAGTAPVFMISLAAAFASGLSAGISRIPVSVK